MTRSLTASHPAAVREDAGVTTVYLEMGKRRVFACAADWPGWCRAGRTEDAALAALAGAASRYAAVCAWAGVVFDPAAAVAGLSVRERVTGSATTDFGALDVPPALDTGPVAAAEAARLAALAEAAWNVFADTAASAPAELRKGPRGGGRDRDAIVEHVLAVEVLHARMLGLRQRPFPRGDQQAAASVRALILAAIRAGGPDPGAVGGRRPVRFVARRTAWHALDHAWEIEDRQEPG